MANNDHCHIHKLLTMRYLIVVIDRFRRCLEALLADTLSEVI